MALLNKGACVSCKDVALDPTVGTAWHVGPGGQQRGRGRALEHRPLLSLWGSAHHVAGPGAGSLTFSCQQLVGLFASWPTSCVVI